MNNLYKKRLLIVLFLLISLFFCINTYAQQEQISTKSVELKKANITQNLEFSKKLTKTNNLYDVFKFNNTKEIYYIFIGDSRTVGTDKIIDNENTLFIGKVGSGQEWLSSTVKEELNEIDIKNKQIVVISWFGVNDLGNIEKYIDTYHELINQHKDWLFLFPSIGEVEESIAIEYNYFIHNQDIILFNKQLKNNFNNQFIDISSIFNVKNFSVDGIHYTEETYKNYYDFVLNYTKNFLLLNEYDCLYVE